MQYSDISERNDFLDELGFDLYDWLDFDQTLFEEFDFYDLDEEQDADFIQDQPPPPATNELVSDIRGGLLQHGTPAQRNRRLTRSFVAHTVEQRPQQSEPTGNVQSLVDVSFVGRDKKRVNLEVDPTGQIHAHRDDHIRAMQEAVNNGHPPNSARSVFVGMDNQGRIQQVRHVHYDVRDGRVFEIEDANIVLNRPLTANQAVRQRVLDDPQAAQRRGQSVPSVTPSTAANQPQITQSSNQRTSSRPTPPAQPQRRANQGSQRRVATPTQPQRRANQGNQRRVATPTQPQRRANQGNQRRTATPARVAGRRPQNNRFDAFDDFFEFSSSFY